ncbi:hypothetical protein [Halosolutus gelatinilyticus]|uniref:hypothetical protein n=1 Tax=Halosolutus gelatinilyticus TaxID=2931975 RepID=UPI001FF457D6|nr:hypothetical protein [Halosolutus gelatinilyticus]
MTTVQAVLDEYGDGTPVRSLAAAYRSFERWTGDEPVLLVAEAAASTTGQRFVGGVKPAVERFREAFVAADRAPSFADLAALDVDDDALVAALGAQRKRGVLLEIAAVLADRPESDDLDALRAWAAEADQYRYEADPIGSISGVGPASFQYLRQLAGVEAVCPSPAVRAFLDLLAADLESAPRPATALDAAVLDATPLRTIAACEWLSLRTTYTPLEVDRLAWWTCTDPDDREAVLAASGLA